MKQNVPIALGRPAVDALDLTVYGGEFYVRRRAGVSSATVRHRRWSLRFRRRSPPRVLGHKEWTLLLRDPWLISQTLMQILYLLPPAMLLWVTFHDRNDSFVLLIPVVVMAAGQLAGGLAWLSISGEDAPIWSQQRRGADARFGVCRRCCALGILSAAAAATPIQPCFRVQARRNQFRRRQTSSRLATFAEAFSSIAWAATTALAASASWAALGTAAIAFAVLGAVWLISPSRA